jgi:glucan biosynthesis protein C
MNQISPGTQEYRLLFFDNIRYLMIIFVIALHAAASYITGAWWYVYNPKENTIIFTLIFFFIDTFAMPTLFYGRIFCPAQH